MLKAKFGSCSGCGEENQLLYRRNPPMCQKCNWEFKKQKAKKKGKKPPRKVISLVSKKRLDQLKKYREIRDRYLADHPICEVHDCNKPTTNLHHRAGREGELLYMDEYFMACCETCHPKRIHENPAWARERGYIIDVNLK